MKTCSLLNGEDGTETIAILLFFRRGLTNPKAKHLSGYLKQQIFIRALSFKNFFVSNLGSAMHEKARETLLIVYTKTRRQNRYVKNITESPTKAWKETTVNM